MVSVSYESQSIIGILMHLLPFSQLGRLTIASVVQKGLQWCIFATSTLSDRLHLLKTIPSQDDWVELTAIITPPMFYFLAFTVSQKYGQVLKIRDGYVRLSQLVWNQSCGSGEKYCCQCIFDIFTIISHLRKTSPFI